MNVAAASLAAGFLDASPSVWIGLAAIVAALYLLTGNLKRRARSGGAADSGGGWRGAAADAARRGRHGSAEQEIQQLMIELEELSRRVSGQVETRFRKLELTIADADRRIAELRGLLDVRGAAGDEAAARSTPNDVAPLRNESAASRPVSTPAGATPLSPRSGVIPPAPPAARPGGSTGPPAEPVAAALQRAAGDSADRRQVIYQLADQGIGPADIARRVGRTIGEVELILNLRRAG